MAQLLKTEFEGRLWPVLRLSLWTSMLTVVTLGFYRFWMKTRLRRYFWSSVRPDQTPLEYVGKGIEKFTGFLIALVILALLIGVLALLLVYASYAVFNEEFEAYLAAGLIAVPLIYFASYRAKRYVYARTRWRGIRFGLEPAAGKYALHAMGHLLLTILTAGLLWPRMTFKLEKFRTDRTFFGDQRLTQGGRWSVLFKAFAPALIFGWGIAACVSYLAFSDSMLLFGTFPDDASGDAFDLHLPMILISICLFPLMLLAYARYRVHAFRYLTTQKRAGKIEFISRASFPRVFWIHTAGYTLTNIATALAAFVVGAVISGLLVLFYPALMDFGLFAATGVAEGLDLPDEGLPSTEVTLFISIFLYMATLLFFAVFRQSFVLFPIWRHYSETLTIIGGEHLQRIGQRARDEAGQAEGMAEAFDLGAAI